MSNKILNDGKRTVEIRILTKSKREASFKETILTILVEDAQYAIDVNYKILPNV